MTSLTKSSRKEKGEKREKELDATRCIGNWSKVQEIAEKYQKYNPVGAALALAECTLIRAIEKIENNYDDDSPESITLQQTIGEASIKEVFEKVEAASAEAQEKECASVILARAYFVVGKYDECMKALSADFVPQELPTGYYFILIIQGLIIKGTAHEALSDFDNAISCYDQAVTLLNSNSDQVVTLLQNSNEYNQMSNWSEEVFYRISLLKVRLGDKKGALQTFRIYKSYTTHWGEKFRINKRAVIYNYFIKLLSVVYQEGIYVPSNEQTSIYTPHIPRTFRAELTELHLLYENILLQITPYPKAGEVNWRVLEMIDQIMSDWDVLGGGTSTETRELIEMLHRATTKTFHSPSVLRHLINTLITYGDYEEAELALNAYIALVEKGKETKIEDIEKQMHDSLEEDTNSKTDKHTMVPETSEKVIQTMISGSELMAKYMNKPQQALEIAQKAIHWYEDDGSLNDDELSAHAWRCFGVGYSLLAAEETDPNKRPELHNKAIEALNKSISLDSEAFESHYRLSLEYAVIRDISQAIISVKQALTLNSSSIPCWHLLVLLFSSQKDIQGALKACELGVKESDWETVDYNTSLSVTGNDDGDEFLSLKLTQNALQELANGPDTSIQNFDKLFLLYVKMFPDYNVIQSPNGSVHDTTQSRKQNSSYEEPITPKLLSGSSVKSFASTEKKEDYVTESSFSSFGNKDTLDVPKANYSPSIASSKNSGRSPTQTISGVQLSTTKSIGSHTSSSHVTLKSKQRRQRAFKILTDLWLASASTFRRLGNLEEAQKAIESADEVDSSSPNVWCQFGLYLFTQGNYTDAMTSFYKALSIDNNHVPSLVHLARTYMETGDLEMAEGILDNATKSNGWNCAEAWFHLGKICQITNRVKRAKDCLWYALDLEESKPVRPFNVLPKCL